MDNPVQLLYMFDGNNLSGQAALAGKATRPSQTVRRFVKVSRARATKPLEVIREVPEIATSAHVNPITGFELLQIGTVPLLTPAEEISLAAQIKRGSQKAREHLIRANLRLVIKIAREYEHLGLPLADLVSEGTIGLMKAVDRFEPKKGSKLSTYGALWIRQQIRRALANQARTIRLPVHVEAKLYHLGRAETRLQNVLGREATEEELQQELGIGKKRFTRLRQASLRPSSLDLAVGEDGETNLGDLVPDERAAHPLNELERKVDHALLRQCLEQLSEREATILRHRFGLDGGDEQTLEEIGKKFRLTRERIRQVQNEALKKLRLLMERRPLVPLAA
jgi:RNA polymerase primary sigma factor